MCHSPSLQFLPHWHTVPFFKDRALPTAFPTGVTPHPHPRHTHSQALQALFTGPQTLFLPQGPSLTTPISLPSASIPDLPPSCTAHGAAVVTVYPGVLPAGLRSARGQLCLSRCCILKAQRGARGASGMLSWTTENLNESDCCSIPPVPTPHF